MSETTTPPVRKPARWYQFTLRDCMIATVAIAVTIVPFKLHERFNPPAELVMFRMELYQVPSDALQALTRDWTDGELRTTSPEKVAKLEAQLKSPEVGAKTITRPTLITLSGQESAFMIGSTIPRTRSQGIEPTSLKLIDVGLRFSVRPLILPNGRIQLDMVCQQTVPSKGTTVEAEEDDHEVETADLDEPASPNLSSPRIDIRTTTIPTEIGPDETLFLIDGASHDPGQGLVIQIKAIPIQPK